MGGVGPVVVVVAAHPSMITRASSSESKRHELSSSSRSRPLNDSIQAFCHGEPGSMKSEAAPVNRHESLTAWATNSGPLSKRHVGRGAEPQGETIQYGDAAIGVDAAVTSFASLPERAEYPPGGRFGHGSGRVTGPRRGNASRGGSAHSAPVASNNRLISATCISARSQRSGTRSRSARKPKSNRSR